MQGICEYCQTRPCFIFNRFCGKKCAALAVNAGLCIFCHKRENTAGHRFCSKACADSAQFIGGAIHKKKLPQFQPVKRTTKANDTSIPDNALLSRTIFSLSLPKFNGRGGKTPTDELKEKIPSVSSRDLQASDLRHNICSLPGCTRTVSEDMDGHYCSPKHEREASPQSFNEQ
ncbi:hypothetical protein SCHPADRAFT_734427 [Schizopora paradoxa]|uniref:Uncharacterized protein n=1 Tax=Schizopora paradoxa TaxID=27342 RepID=A0A0H2R6R2_9AGAM|nr:hypothetical protein SCHPADRAFT_734427 [Schizopora paradoxa]